MKLIRYLKKYWIFALLAPLFMIGEVSVDLMQPKLLSVIVDDGILGSDINLIIKTGLTMLGLVVLGGLSGICSSAFAGLASQNFSNDLRKDVYDRVMHLSFQQTDKFTTGSLITRLTNDITQVQDMLNMFLRMFVRSGFMFAGGIVMTLSLNIQFGTILAVSLPILLVIIILFLAKATPYFSVVQKKLDRVNSVVQENVSGTRVVKAYVREEYEKDRFDEANNNLMQTNLKVQKILATAMPVLMIIMNLTVTAIIYIGGYNVKAQTMQVGQIMAGVTYATMIIFSLMMVSMMFQAVSRAGASAKRLCEVLDSAPVITSGKGAGLDGRGKIEFKNVSFSYPDYSGKPILNNISFTVNPGETVAILGSTGSGKSSLVNLIPRFYDVSGGAVEIDGINVKEYGLDELRKTIGVVLQTSELFSGTIEENILWGNESAAHEDVVNAAKIAQADGFITGFANGYNTIIEEKGSSLSGGQKQRLCIARAITKKPKILIFDDSTSALDLSTEAKLHSALREHLKDMTVIMVAQRIASVMRADKIIVIENGIIAACGTHDELLNSSDIYQDIYSSQMKKGA